MMEPPPRGIIALATAWDKRNGPFQIHVKYRVPPLFGHVEEVRLIVDGRAIDECVNASPRLNRRVDHLLTIGRECHVTPEWSSSESSEASRGPAAASFSRSVDRPMRTTLPPISRKSLATPRPIPPPPPVIRVTVSVNCVSVMPVSLELGEVPGEFPVAHDLVIFVPLLLLHRAVFAHEPVGETSLARGSPAKASTASRSVRGTRSSRWTSVSNQL